MLGFAESQVPRLISVKLFSKNSNACDHNPPTLRTDGQTNNLSRQYRAPGTVEDTSKLFASNITF